MINDLTAVVATNLAVAISQSGVSLTPMPGSLVSELSRSVIGRMDLVKSDFSETDGRPNIDSIVSNIVYATEGTRARDGGYEPSSHDLLMDNYLHELPTLVTNHVSFARNVVYKKMQMFAEEVNSFISSLKIRQAEDFFVVKFFRLNDFFKSQFLSDELAASVVIRTSAEIINFGESMNEEFDIVGYLLTGENDTDELLKSWANEVGKTNLLRYVQTDLDEFQLGVEERLNYSLTNFLFYRNLTLKQDLANGMSTLQLVTKASVCRDYHMSNLKFSIQSYNQSLLKGDILTNDSEVRFSYMVDRNFTLTVLADSYDKAAEQGASLESLFGYVAKYGQTDLTVSSLVANKEEYERVWMSTRALYGSYLLKNKEFIRMQLKSSFMDVMNKDRSDDETQFETSHVGFKEETAKLVNEYIDSLTVTELDEVDSIAFTVIAKIAYRYTKASRIIGDMLELQSVNPDIDMKEAAYVAAVNYVTDFLMEQCYSSVVK
ncbi:hypothetical protein [Flavobacterium sp.]|jgi:hypothetical protein|uniref:hypothetical protein n=1 Tax=Flavobacterium sp. TaxID=239 RepID=UPI0037BE37BC